MRPRTHADRQCSPQQRRKDENRSDTVVATVWLAFYVLAISVTILSPVVTRAIDMAAR